MKFGIPAQTHAGETRVTATPEMVNKHTASRPHTLLVQYGAGAGMSIPDERYVAAGATVVINVAEVQ